MNWKLCWSLLAALFVGLIGCVEIIPETNTVSTAVTITRSIEIQTAHPYANNEDLRWDIVAPSDAESVTVVFDRFETERSYDFVDLYDAGDNRVHHLSGELSGQSFTVPGSVMRIRFTSDWLITGWGISAIQYSYEIDEPEHPTDHRPFCGAIGSRSEGWYWGDTNELIRWERCADLDEPQCGAIGSRSEGWYSNGERPLITWDNCHQTVRISLVGENCGPSIGFSCYGPAYCQGLPGEGVIGGSGICRSYGYCEADADCTVDENMWNHPMCMGQASCESNQCIWHCQQGNAGPWSWTTVLLRDVESAHPYSNNFNDTWDVVRPGADEIRVHFQRIDLEAGYDQLVLTGDREEYALMLDGIYEDYWSPEFGGDTLHINLQTDYSVTRWGFRADMVSYYEQLPADHCNRNEDCALGLSCIPLYCFNPYEPCYGECHRDDHCDDGTTPMCDIIMPVCPDGMILAHQSNCYVCVDPGTCQPLYGGEGDTCDEAHACPDGFYCKAMHDGVGECRDELWCHPDTVYADCAGAIHPAIPGFWACADSQCSWQASMTGGSFTNDESIDIPDNNASGITSQIQVTGLTPGDYEVTLDLTITHTYRGDLVVGLTDPSGQSQVLHQREGGSSDNLVFEHLILSEQLGAEGVNGIWTLDVSDHANYDIGAIESWTLAFN